MYSRLYLTLAYFYAQDINSEKAKDFFLHPNTQDAKLYFSIISEKVKKYLYKFTKIKSIESDLESYLEKY
jgi:hypothetical protein